MNVERRLRSIEELLADAVPEQTGPKLEDLRELAAWETVARSMGSTWWERLLPFLGVMGPAQTPIKLEDPLYKLVDSIRTKVWYARCGYAKGPIYFGPQICEAYERGVFIDARCPSCGFFWLTGTCPVCGGACSWPDPYKLAHDGAEPEWSHVLHDLDRLGRALFEASQQEAP